MTPSALGPGRCAARALGAVAALAAVVAGCGAASTPAEYGLYRKSRVTPSVEDRLAAAQDYLKRYPRGAFVEDVREAFAHDEGLFYKAKRGSVLGLASYLRALPEGPHGVEAKQRMSSLRTKNSRGEDLRLQGVATNARLEREVAARARVRTETVDWVARFLSPVVFRAPIAAAPPEVIVPWALALPSPHCKPLDAPAPAPPPPRAAHTKKPAPPPAPVAVPAWRCERVEELEYVIIGKSGPEPREAALSIAMDQDKDGRPLVVTVAGPELFMRLEEAGVVRAFDHQNSEHRIGAVSRAVELLRDQFRKRISVSASCEKPVVSPVVLDLKCDGIELTVRAGLQPDEDDVVTVRAER